MTFRFALAAFCGAALLVAQPKPSEVPPETVIATVGGTPVTAGELADFLDALPPQQMPAFERDRKEFLRQWALMKRLAALAEQEGLDKQKTNLNRLNYVRLQVLMSAMLEKKSNDSAIDDDVLRKIYDQRTQGSASALTKVLYIAFGSARTETEAKGKIDALRKLAVDGADFVKLIEQHSEDAASKSKKGDYQPIKQSDPLPEAIKSAILALKPGEYSQPIRQAGGFYLFRLEKLDQRTFEEMKPELIAQQRQAAFGAWFNKVREGMDIQFTNNDFFTRPAPAAPAAAPPPAKP